MQITDLRDVRQLKTLEFYRNPKSETFGNLKQSAIKAGYDDEYANNLSTIQPLWLSASVKKDVARVLRAEKNLDKMLNVEISLDTKNGIDVAKLQMEVSKFILKTIARQKYNEDQEQMTPNVQINIVNYNEKEKTVEDQTIEAQVVEAKDEEAQ